MGKFDKYEGINGVIKNHNGGRTIKIRSVTSISKF